MHVLVDALSVNNLSGRHVLLGHLRQLATRSGHCRFTVLSNSANESILEQVPDQVGRERASTGPGWFQRAAWSTTHGASLCRRLGIDAVFSPSGMRSLGFVDRQVVLAQNPWPLVPAGAGSAKSMLQRRAFRSAQLRATVMVFNSKFMRSLYGNELGTRNGSQVVAYQGIEDAMLASGTSRVGAGRDPEVLCVSVFARHKAIEVLIDALARVRERIPAARLTLAGSWPDEAYRREIEARIAQRGLERSVRILGHVTEAELHGLYGTAAVFCLLSRCESFGIPAVEAQAFGTPVIVADGTAAPEIVGEGGLVVPQDDPAASAKAIESVLSDSDASNELSLRARRNAERFNWRDCSTPLVLAFDEMAALNG